jgi:hypothetical protein
MASCVSLSDESFALRLSSLKAMARGVTQRQVFTTAVDAASHASRWADGARSGTTGRGGGSSVDGQLCSCTTCGTGCLATRGVDGDAGGRVIAGVVLMDGKELRVEGDGAAAAWRGDIVHGCWLLACDGSARPHRRKQSPHSSQCDGDLAAPPHPDPRPPHARRFHRISTAPRPPWPTGSPPSTSSTLVRCAAAPPVLLRTHC